MQNKFLTANSRITDAYMRMYSRGGNVNESTDNGGKSLVKSLKGALPIDGRGSSKTGSKLGVRKVLPFEKRDAKNKCGHTVPVKKTYGGGRVKTTAVPAGKKEVKHEMPAKTGSKLGVRKVLPFVKRDERPTTVGRISNVKDVSKVKKVRSVKESKEELDFEEIEGGEGSCGCEHCDCERKDEVLDTVLSAFEQIYDNLSDDDKETVDEVRAEIESVLNPEDGEEEEEEEENNVGESSVNEGAGAGYTVTIKGLRLGSIVEKKLVPDEYFGYYECKVEVLPGTYEIGAEDYYNDYFWQEHEIGGTPTAKIDGGVATVLYSKQWKDDEQAEEDLRENVEGSEIDISFDYGWGWIHQFLPRNKIETDHVDIVNKNVYFDISKLELDAPDLADAVNSGYKSLDDMDDEEAPDDEVEDDQDFFGESVVNEVKMAKRTAKPKSTKTTGKTAPRGKVVSKSSPEQIKAELKERREKGKTSKTEPAKTEPSKTEPAKTEPSKTEPALDSAEQTRWKKRVKELVEKENYGWATARVKAAKEIFPGYVARHGVETVVGVLIGGGAAYGLSKLFGGKTEPKKDNAIEPDVGQQGGPESPTPEKPSGRTGREGGESPEGGSAPEVSKALIGKYGQEIVDAAYRAAQQRGYTGGTAGSDGRGVIDQISDATGRVVGGLGKAITSTIGGLFGDTGQGIGRGVRGVRSGFYGVDDDTAKEEYRDTVIADKKARNDLEIERERRKMEREEREEAERRRQSESQQPQSTTYNVKDNLGGDNKVTSTPDSTTVQSAGFNG